MAKKISPREQALMDEMAGRSGKPVESFAKMRESDGRPAGANWDPNRAEEARLAPTDGRGKGALSQNFDGNASGTNITGGQQSTFGMIKELGVALDNAGTERSHGTQLLENKMNAAGLSNKP